MNFFFRLLESTDSKLKESGLSRPLLFAYLLFTYVCAQASHWFLNINFHLGYERWLFPPLSLLSCAYQPFQLRLFFSLLMISSLFGKSTLWHSREMSMFGWGKITVVLDLLNSLFHSVLNSHSTGSLSLYLLTHYYPLLLPYNYRSIIWFMSQTINNSGTLCFCKSSSCTFSNNPFNFL